MPNKTKIARLKDTHRSKLYYHALYLVHKVLSFSGYFDINAVNKCVFECESVYLILPHFMFQKLNSKCTASIIEIE